MRYPRKQNLPRPHAFTSVELLIVIAVIAILVLIAIPLWRKFAPGYKLSKETERVVQELRLAQQRTVTEQLSYIVRFAVDTEGYEVIRLIPDTGNPGEYIEEFVETETLDPDVGFNALYDLTEPEIQFTSAGGVVDDGQIELINVNGDMTLIDVRPSGFISY